MSSAAARLEVLRATAEVLCGRGGPAALATVIGRSGSAPQVVGARLLLRADGSMVGTVGGGAIEAQVLEACRTALRDGSPQRVKAPALSGAFGMAGSVDRKFRPGDVYGQKAAPRRVGMMFAPAATWELITQPM